MASSKLDPRLAFLVEWYDKNAELYRNYQLLFYPYDNSIEMFDVKQQRWFLKRTAYPDIHLVDLFVGGSVNVYSRHLVIKDYADEFTRSRLERDMERAIIIIPPKVYLHYGQVADTVVRLDLAICHMRMLAISQEKANVLANQKNYQNIFKGSGPSLAIEVMSPNLSAKVHSLSESLCKLYPELENNIYVSIDKEKVEKDRESIFSSSSHLFPRTAKLSNNTTLCIIKPHAVNRGDTGRIIDSILQNGFAIYDLEMLHMEYSNVEEFLEIYKGVLQGYQDMVQEMASGMIVAMEIGCNELPPEIPNVVQYFREFAGPHNPEIAKQLRPHSLRAKFGIDEMKNAIHCTDLPEDGPLEVEYFFKLLLG